MWPGHRPVVCLGFALASSLRMAWGLRGAGVSEADKEGLAFDLQETGLGLLPARSKAAAALGQRPPMMWVHISKAAGSLVCHLAKLNGERVVEPELNCNWEHHDDALLLGRNFHDDSCSQRTSYFQSHGYTWGAIEREVNRQDLCTDYFSYGVLFRDPVELALSYAKFWGYTKFSLDHYLHCAANRSVTGICSDRPELQRVPLATYFDNIAVRQLGGFDTYSLPPGGITEKHVQQVISRLTAHFRVVMLWEDVHKPDVWRDAFGWETLPLDGEVRIEAPRTMWEITLTPAQEALARKLLVHDYALIDHFRRLPAHSRVKKRPH